MSDKVAQLEARVKELEIENKKKDELIKRLSSGSGATAPGAAPPKPAPPGEDAQELLCYDDDKALGATAPPLSTLTFVKGDSISLSDKVTVVTFFCNLNKGDFVTMTVLSDIYQKYKEGANFIAISRDHNLADAEKWNKKYNGLHMAEQKNPDGSPGVDVRCDFHICFDPEHKFNNALKTAMGKATIGVGFTVIIDKEGKIRWYEPFVRGVNPAGQFEYQLHAIINGSEMLSNGNAPEIVEEEIEGDEGVIPDDIDAFGGGDGNY